MNLDAALAMARAERLYPSVILYGSTFEDRRKAALELSRTLLCVADDGRPCGACRHCRRIAWPGESAERFHPDFHVLERDLRATTSIDATKSFLATTVATPFEARGQIFVVAEADTLGPGAGDVLLKTLEEPPQRTPRHFMLLAPSRLDLLPTLRSRSLAIYLGGAEELDEELVDEVALDLGHALDAYFETSAPVWLLAAAQALSRIPGWEDPRARKPWATAAAAVLRYARSRDEPAEAAGRDARRRLYALAQELLDAWTLRLRAITAERILEGLVSRHLGGLASAAL